MKKLLVILLVIILIGAVGAGAYKVGYDKGKSAQPKTSAATKSSSGTSTNKTESNKQLDLKVVLSNLQKQYPTVQQTYIYSQDRDPNNNLGKPGFYTSGANFYDTRTNTAPDGNAFGTDSGGAIEVYANSTDAAKRIAYLKSFQGQGALDPGAFKQVDNVVVRASSTYNATDQAQMVNYLVSQVKSQVE